MPHLVLLLKLRCLFARYAPRVFLLRFCIQGIYTQETNQLSCTRLAPGAATNHDGPGELQSSRDKRW